jgi:glycosyltransferase involved in cell wall biosynthesis
VALFRLLRRQDIVVAKTDPPLISIVAWVAARARRAILINWLQDVFPEVASRLGATPLPPALNRSLQKLRDGSLRAAAGNVVLGARMRDYLSARLGSAAKLKIIENWAVGDGAQPKATADSALRARLNLGRQFVVGYSGNLGRAHEYETVLGAAQALHADEEIAFLFIGGGVKMDELSALVERRGLRNFHFLPYQPKDQLADSLGAADIHLVNLLPALEGLIVPSKFYGILAARRPVVFIGDPDGELARIIREANCGRIVAAGDSAGLTRIIGMLKDDSSGCESMSVAGHELLRSRFSSQQAFASWTALLDEARTARSSTRQD